MAPSLQNKSWNKPLLSWKGKDFYSKEYEINNDNSSNFVKTTKDIKAHIFDLAALFSQNGHVVGNTNRTTASSTILQDSLTANGLSDPTPVTWINECALYSPQNDPDPEMILTPKWSPTLKWSPNWPRNNPHFSSCRPRNDPQGIMEWWLNMGLWIAQ